MNGLPYYKRYPRDFIEGTIGMGFEMKAAYGLVLDIIYMQGGNLVDDARYISGLLGCSVRKWTALRLALIEAGKLVARDGYLGNYRADKELETLRKYQTNQSENRARPNKINALESPPSNHTEPDTDKEPIANAIGKKRAPKAVCQMPADWLLTKALGEWAVAEGFTADEVRAEASKFETHHRAKGSKFKDWDLAFKKWIGNAKDFRAERKRATDGKPQPGETRVINGVLKCYEPAMGGWQVIHA